jgi:hypothetical protein
MGNVDGPTDPPDRSVRRRSRPAGLTAADRIGLARRANVADVEGFALLVGVLFCLHPTSGSASAAQAGWVTYRDADGRFQFTYPPAFGVPGPGTDSGYGGRVAVVRFTGLGGLGGEAVLTSGAVSVDLQALGGLYDTIALQIFRPADVPRVRAAVPALTADNFCRLLGAADHLGATPSLSGPLLDAARQVDRMRNIDPAVVNCSADGEAIAFQKTATYQAGAVSSRQHIFGAIRFLAGRYWSFQIVRASGSPPSGDELSVLARVVNSLEVAR